MISYNNWLDFEIFIMDLAESYKIDNAKDLQNLADDLHTHVEIALEDYADDYDFRDDYEPSY